jgi:hypothetical protein
MLLAIAGPSGNGAGGHVVSGPDGMLCRYVLDDQGGAILEDRWCAF